MRQHQIISELMLLLQKDEVKKRTFTLHAMHYSIVQQKAMKTYNIFNSHFKPL